MKHRIEIAFVGDAPEGELERARIMAHPDVLKAINELSEVLKNAGLVNTVTAHTVRTTDRKPRAIHGRLAAE